MATAGGSGISLMFWPAAWGSPPPARAVRWRPSASADVPPGSTQRCRGRGPVLALDPCSAQRLHPAPAEAAYAFGTNSNWWAVQRRAVTFWLVLLCPAPWAGA